MKISLSLFDAHEQFINGIVTMRLRNGEEIVAHAGGGFILTAADAHHENACRGMNTRDFPLHYWPGAYRAGDLLPYEGNEIGDIDTVAETCRISQDEAESLIQKLSHRAYKSKDRTASLRIRRGRRRARP